MEIFPPELSYQDDKAVVSVRFTCQGKESTLWYKFDKEFAEFAVLEKADAFLVSLLPLAMQSHEDIQLNHPVSEELFYNITEYLIPVMLLCMPELTKTKVNPEGFSDINRNGRDGVVGTGFSCGIDSFLTIAEHMRPEIPPSNKITHGVFMDVGAHGIQGDEASRLRFTRRLENARSCATELGLRLVVIESNISQFIHGAYLNTHALRNTGAVLVLEKLFRIYYYSSGVPFENIEVSKEMTNCEPMVLSYLSTNHLRFVSSGVQYKRVDKVAIVSNFEPSYRYLNVCTNEGDNCSKCEKCLRTQFSLDMHGKLDRYARVFDLEKYRRKESRFIFSVIATRSRDIYSKERYDLMKRVGYKLGAVDRCHYPSYKARHELRFQTNSLLKKATKRRNKILDRAKASKLYEESGAFKRIVSLMERPLIQYR
jgi:hypothetical protein